MHKAWEGKKMSNIKPNDFRKYDAEEEFFRLAAMEIESEQNEKFLEAQSLPNPSPEILMRMQKNLQTSMRQTRNRKRRHTIFLYLGRLTACAAVVCCVFISGIYFNVGAARNSINNFVLELFDDHAVIRTDDSELQSGSRLPMNWNAPIDITWIPAKFTNVQALSFDCSWQLQYSNSQSTDNLLICVWDASFAPSIDVEDSTLIEQIEIQGSAASIYLKTPKKIYTLFWAKDNYVVMITGNISLQEIQKIAENIRFSV